MLKGQLDFESQSVAYQKYLRLFDKLGIGYFAYAYSEPKPHNPHQSFGIVYPDKNGNGKIITPAAEVLAFYNWQSKQTE